MMADLNRRFYLALRGLQGGLCSELLWQRCTILTAACACWTIGTAVAIIRPNTARTASIMNAVFVFIVIEILTSRIKAKNYIYLKRVSCITIYRRFMRLLSLLRGLMCNYVFCYIPRTETLLISIGIQCCLCNCYKPNQLFLWVQRLCRFYCSQHRITYLHSNNNSKKGSSCRQR